MSDLKRCSQCGLPISDQVAGGQCPACLLKQAMHQTETIRGSSWEAPSVETLARALPNLDILEMVGQGGMGAVYKARQRSLDRVVALKILAPIHAESPDFSARFTREAKLLGGISHPNIVAVHDFGQSNGFYYLLMEYVDGVNLRQAMNAAKLTPEQALRIIPPICEALQYAHDRGIVHRDIKPENLLLDRSGQIKVVDFGIARILRSDPQASDTINQSTGAKPDEANAANVHSTSVIGTPRYMAPEQFSDPASVDHHADIYALGVVLYEMLTGKIPDAKLELPSSKIAIDVRLDAIVLKALQTQPELRFSTATELRQTVELVSSEIPQSGKSAAVVSPNQDAIAMFPRRIEQAIICEASELRQVWTQFSLWTSKSMIDLDDDALTIRKGAQTIKIELDAISQASVRVFPTLVNPMGLFYVRLDAKDVDSKLWSLCIMPQRLRFGLPATFNEAIIDWYEELAIRYQNRTGMVLDVHPDDNSRNTSFWMLMLLALPAFVLMVGVPAAMLKFLGAGTYSMLVVPALLFVMGFLAAVVSEIRSRIVAAACRSDISTRNSGIFVQATQEAIHCIGCFRAGPSMRYGYDADGFSKNTCEHSSPTASCALVPGAPLTELLSDGEGSLLRVVHNRTTSYVVYYEGEMEIEWLSTVNIKSNDWSRDVFLMLPNRTRVTILQSTSSPMELSINGSKYQVVPTTIFLISKSGTIQMVSQGESLPVSCDAAMVRSLILKRQNESTLGEKKT